MAKERIKISEHFTYKKLLKFVFPSVVMMVFTSVYGTVDGLFVSNFAGKTPFAAVNLIWPLIMLLGTLGFMVGTGGTAVVAKTMGEGREKLANRYFSMLVYFTVAGGAVIAAAGFFMLRPVAVFLGAEGDMIDDCVLYGRIIFAALPFFMLQNVFQSFFVTAEKPKLGLLVTVGAGLANTVLDFVFVAVLKWGLAGAAAATAASQFVGGAVPLLYFARDNDSLLRLGKTKLYGKVLWKTATNGSSELMSNASASIVTTVFNFQVLKFAGEDGLAAYSVLMYVSFIFAAVSIGYAIGVSPVVSYNFGAGDTAELKSLFRKSLVLVGTAGVLMLSLGEALAVPLSTLFAGYDPGLYALTVRAFRLFAVSFLLSGFNIFGSAFFTALNNGGISAFLSFSRTLVFQLAGVFLLPLVLDTDGIWLSMVVSELLAFAATAVFLFAKRKKYQYA